MDSQKKLKKKCIASCSGKVKYKVPIIWVLGGPGSGKGTQCDLIIDKYKFTHLSTGDLLRAEVASGSERGKTLNETMEKGELVSNECVLELLKDAMERQAETATGFLIDGYPREKEQGMLFEQTITRVDGILFFDVSEKTLIERLTERAKTSGRKDDNAATIKNRIKTFNENNQLVISQYKQRLYRINAEGTVQKVFKTVDRIIKMLLEKKEEDVEERTNTC